MYITQACIIYICYIAFKIMDFNIFSALKKELKNKQKEEERRRKEEEKAKKVHF